MIQEGAGVEPEGGSKEGVARYQQIELFVEVWSCLQEEVSLVEGFAEELIALDGISLQQSHLLEITDASMCHFGRSA